MVYIEIKYILYSHTLEYGSEKDYLVSIVELLFILDFFGDFFHERLKR